MKKIGTVSLYRDEGTYMAAYTFWPGHPGSWYRRNGDPGDPPEPDEIELRDVVLHDNSGNTVAIENPADELVEALHVALYDQLERAA